MILCGIDPGTRSGWCIYDTDARCVIASGQFDGDYDFTPCDLVETHSVESFVIERPKGYGPTRPQLVDCGYTAGRLAERVDANGFGLQELTRHEVCKILSGATHGSVRVKNDATAWAALKLLHGEDCDKKGGAIYGVRAHERAALAVAVAWQLRVEAIA